MQKHSGECLCGGMRYEIAGPLPDAIVCHCSVCRKAFNGSGSYVTWIDPRSFSWERGADLLATYANRHGVSLGFCSRCGSRLCGLSEGQVLFVTLGSLNAAPDVRIGKHVFVGSKAPWDEIGGNAPQFDARPTPEGPAR